MPFCTSNFMLIYWFGANFTIGIPSFLPSLMLEKYETGMTALFFYYSSFMLLNTGSMSSEVTSRTSWSVFFTLRTKYYLHLRQSSTSSTEHLHSQGYLKSSALSLMKGIRPIIWQSHSSWRTEVFSMMLTRCGANVGTYEIRTLRRAFAKLTSQPDNENFNFSGLISKI